MAKTLKKIAEGTLKKVLEPFYAGGAAELSFWLILSLVPATILLAQLLQIFAMSLEAAGTILKSYLSEEIFELVAPLLAYKPGGGGVTIILIVLALWSGSTAIFTLMRITNRAYGTIPKKGSAVAWVIMERMRAILMMLLVLLTIIFALYILVFGELLVQAILSYNNVFLGQEYTFSEVWFAVRWLIAFALFFLMAYSLYFILPRSSVGVPVFDPIEKGAKIKTVFKKWIKGHREESRRAMPGSLFAAALMLLATWVYTLYIRDADFGNFNILYGGLSSLVVLLLWFYIISYIVITGIQLNATCAEVILAEKNRKEKGS